MMVLKPSANCNHHSLHIHSHLRVGTPLLGICQSEGGREASWKEEGEEPGEGKYIRTCHHWVHA